MDQTATHSATVASLFMTHPLNALGDQWQVGVQLWVELQIALPHARTQIHFVRLQLNVFQAV